MLDFICLFSIFDIVSIDVDLSEVVFANGYVSDNLYEI